MFGIKIVNTYLLITLTIFIFYIYWHFKRNYRYWKGRNIPYINPIVPFGNLVNIVTRKWTLGQAIGECYLEFKKRGEKHGGIYALHRPLYIPVDPVIIKHIMITDSDNFPNRGLYLNEDDDPLSGHLFNMEGNKWRDLRTKLPQVFTTAKMRQMFLMIVNLAEELQTQLDICNKKYPHGIDIKREISKFTTDVISRCGFGLESGTMNDNNLELIKHARSFFDYQFHIYKNAMVLNLPRNILKKFSFKIFKEQSTRYVMDMFLKFNTYRREQKIQREDLASTLLALTEPHENQKGNEGNYIIEPLNDIECTAQMWAFFCASFETSSSTVTFALYELSRNPDCQQKLREEINAVLAKHDNQITYDSVMEMKYLDNIIDETLRLYPVLPLLPRVCKKDYKIPGTDVILEKNTFVMVSNYGIHRDPEYYPNPLQFDPERFTPENKGKRPFIAHLPFGEGPRICIGKRFGLLQSKVALLAIVRNYEASLNAKTKAGCSFGPWELMLRKSGDIWLNLRKLS